MRKHDPALDHIGSHIGKATGIAAVLHGIPVVATAGSGAVVLPLDVCAEFGLRQEDVIRRPRSARALRDAVFKVATLANEHLITARKMLAEAGPEGIGSAFVFRRAFLVFSHVFRRALMGFHHIANWRVGGKSAHNASSFSYTSLFGTINVQILNCLDSFLIFE